MKIRSSSCSMSGVRSVMSVSCEGAFLCFSRFCLPSCSIERRFVEGHCRMLYSCFVGEVDVDEEVYEELHYQLFSFRLRDLLC